MSKEDLEFKEEVVNRLSKLLRQHGDMFFSSGDVEQDYEYFKGVIERQGYWSGTSLRYYFDEDLNFIRTERRN